jgi:farnesyl-diphosphate farnesyltransferase
MATQELLTAVLKSVSRSFYLTLRVLPGAIRPQIGLAYLLARATDTIADTDMVPVTARLEALDKLRARILGSSRDRLEFDGFAKATGQEPGAKAERVLLERIEDALSLLDQLRPEDQACLRQTLDIITSGQELDLRRFELGRAGDAGSASQDGAKSAKGDTRRPILSLATESELDDYAYRVAGCVGEFWTRMCRAHLFPRAALDDAFLMSSGVRFGKGLQLVNILRDLPRDLRLGRCYLPARQLEAVGLAPADLLEPGCEARVRPVYDHWCQQAEAHLAAGWAYTNALPWRSVRVRLACAWPILIGVQTLARLRTRNPLNPAERVKVSRSEVRGLILGSLLRYPFPRAWRRMVQLPDGTPNGRRGVP